MAQVYNPHQAAGKVCYALVNHLSGGHAPLVLGLFQHPEAALQAFAANFDLRRVENSQSLKFRARWDTQSPWAIHEVHMNAVHAMGMLHGTFSVALLFDLEHRVGFVVVEPSQKEKEAAAKAAG